MFREHVSDYLDEELGKTVRALFLGHAAKCPICNQLLHDLRAIKRHLAMRGTESITPEFDFRLKSSVRREARLMENPVYRLRHLLRENFLHVVMLPAAAMLVIGLAIAPLELFSIPGQQETTQTAGSEPTGTADYAEDTAEIHYVMESVTELDADRGIFLSEHPTQEAMRRPGTTLTSVSF